MDAILERLQGHPVVSAFACIVLYSFYTRLVAKSLVPEGLPWVGKQSNRFLSETWASLASFVNVPNWLGDGYEKYSKNDKSFIIPDFSGKPEVVVPRSQVPWLIDQPDNVLSTSAFHYDSLEGDYAFTHPQMLKDPYHEHVVHKYLPRRLKDLVTPLQDELEHAVDESWGTDTKTWKALTVWENMMFVISHITNRMFVGLPLCRNEDYLKNMGGFAMDIMATITLLSFVPHWLKPVVGPVVSIPNRRHWAATTKYTYPLINERKANMQRKKEDPSFEWEEPNDYVTWHIALATAENRQDELDTEIISRRLLPINFAAIHTTVLTATNTLFDLISSDPALGFLEGIREEAARVLAEEGGHWTKAGMARLHRADSAVRESMRCSNFMTRNIIRKVMPKEGITNKVEGWHAPQGTIIGTNMHTVMHDPEIYTNPDSYDAFRFSRAQEEEPNANDHPNGSAEKRPQLKNLDLINTSDTFMPFSHGRHACPGRFFVSLELKMLLAYMALNYDVEHLAERPKSKWMNAIRTPDMQGKIRVKRREGTVKT